ncbi:MAG TPA: hypothetical protein VJT73_18480 [Polyangiaceae bacterium]|nr:hypothetical protein [Polyangiaceae bacterium]
MNEGSGTIAEVALLLWLPISLLAFVTMRPQRAATVVLLGALLFLPEGAKFKFPYLPPFDKHNIPYLCVFAGCLLRCPGRVLSAPRERWFAFLALVLFLGPVGTALTNTDALRYGTMKTVTLPGLTVKDGLYTSASQTLHHAMPFFLGLVLFRSSRDLKDLLAAFAIAGLVYAPFAMVEMRMSPQFHYWIYGYHQHSFLQTLRWGGYRPMVFMSHGLALGRFFVVAMLSAWVVSKHRRALLAVPTRLGALFLFVVLVFCKSTGAILYGLFGLLVALLAGVRGRQRVAMLLAFAVAIYPALRAADLFPVGKILSAAEMVDAAREQSLLFRFENEDAVLAKARQRIAFGWGEYDRALLFDEQARPASVTDGHWIVLVSVMGIVGFAAAFGILLLPVFIVRRRLRRIADKGDRFLLSGLSLIVALVATDLIPNGLWEGYPYLLAGALMGTSRRLAAAMSPRRADLVASTSRSPAPIPP